MFLLRVSRWEEIGNKKCFITNFIRTALLKEYSTIEKACTARTHEFQLYTMYSNQKLCSFIICNHFIQNKWRLQVRTNNKAIVF